jgi:uncharacterized membrane protein required for colicin V production
MISLIVFFWFMVGFFALIGYFRGWQKEVIALAGLVASIAALQQFGFQIANSWPRPLTGLQMVSRGAAAVLGSGNFSPDYYLF